MTTFLIDRCEVHLDRREVLVDGQARTVGPKVFALLVMLLQQRHRVVTKDELVAQIWHGAVLSDSVLARTVMLARRAIDSGNSQDSPIRNHHGQGYRFVADVQVLDAQQPHLPSEQAHKARVALLPCNRTRDDPRLALAGQGFMAMVGDVLRAAGLDTPPITEMLQAHVRIGSSLPEPERARQVMRQLQCSHVVITAVRPQDNALWMDYRIYGLQGPLDSGSLRDATMALLVERLSQALLRLLLSDEPDQAPKPAWEDPFVSEAWARADELLAHEHWGEAEALFHAVAQLVPEDSAAQAKRLQCLVPMRDPRTPTVAGQLLVHPQARDNPDRAGPAHVAMAVHLHRQQQPQLQALALRHASDATRLAQGRSQEHWAVWWLALQARLHLESGQPEPARQAALQAQSRAERHGHTLLQPLAQQGLALLDTMSGDLLQAQQRLQALAELHLQLRRHHSAAEALTWLAICSAELGLLDAAEAQATRAAALLADRPALGDPASVLSRIALVFTERGQLAPLDGVLAQMERCAPALQARPCAPLLAARGAALLLHGQATQGRGLIEAALSSGLASEGPLFVRAWGLLLLRFCNAAAQWAQARRIREQLAQLPGHGNDPMLQSNLVHARACDAWRQGRHRAAMVILQQLIDEYPMTRAEAAARMDLAWLLMEEGELQRAERLLGGCGAWRHQHASGLATLARLHHSRGQHEEAVDLQLQAMRQHRGSVPAEHSALAQAYAEAAAGRLVPLPALPRWISLSWLPG